MLEFSALQFYKVGKRICQLTDRIRSENENFADFPPDEKFFYETMLKAIRFNCAHIGLAMACAQIERLENRLGGSTPSTGQIVSGLEQLDERIQDEMQDKLFFYVPSERARFYARSVPDEPDEPDGEESPQRKSLLEKREQLFGKGVQVAFPAAMRDFEEAGKCLALGRATACVYHLMRVMEHGLKILASGLKIPYAPSWESYLKQIESRITEKHNKKSRGWKQQEHFYKDTMGDLLTVKITWRNPSMHIEGFYTLEDAENVFMAVRTFMQRLATKFTDDSLRQETPIKNPPSQAG